MDKHTSTNRSCVCLNVVHLLFNTCLMAYRRFTHPHSQYVHVYNYIQTSHDAAYLARHAALKAGIPIPVPALTVNRLCGSGFQSVVSGAHVRMQY